MNEQADRVSARVELVGVTHRFASGTWTLQDVSLKAGPHEFIAIVGPSGCGKSTILNLVSGLMLPTAGKVLVDGSEVAGIQARKIGYMFARDGLLPWRTAQENVELGLEIEGKRDRHATARQFLDLVGLGNFSGAYRGQLSQGMRQRVALARTLATEPEILLMDEPFSALDAQTRVLMADEFLRLWGEQRQTVVWVTHDLQEAILLADKILVLTHRPARIRALYPVEFERPRSLVDLGLDQRYQALLHQLWEDLIPENDAAFRSDGATGVG